MLFSQVIREPKLKRFIFSCLIFIILAALGAGCAGETAPVSEERVLLDTMIKITAYPRGASENKISETFDDAFDAAAAVEKHLDTHTAGSEAARFNRRTTRTARPQRVSKDMWEALAAGKSAFELTGGAFDPTVGAVTRLWDFDRRIVPDPADLRNAQLLVDGNILKLDSGPPRTARLTVKGARVDLGGLGKGLAVDKMAEIMKKRGVSKTLINGISSIKAVGPKPDGRPWLVGIQSPRPKTTPGMIAVVELKRGSISTSGDYQRTFSAKGRWFHHILDPRTGRPARGFMSVTVVTDKSALYADALSTGMAVMGREKALRLANRLPGTGVLFVDGRGRVWISNELQPRLREFRKRVY